MTQSACEELHRLCWTAQRFEHPFNPGTPAVQNGVYVMFEKGERAHGGARIVRIGSHTGEDRLVKRLQEHYVDGGRSIFRRHVMHALLRKNKKYKLLKQFKKHIEESGTGIPNTPIFREWDTEVSIYIWENISFIVFAVRDKQARLKLEKQLIATVAQCPQCHASSKWLGHYALDKKIGECGLWQVQHLRGKPLTAIEMQRLR